MQWFDIEVVQRRSVSRYLPGIILIALLGADYLSLRDGLNPFDPALILAMRVPGDPGQVLGPPWLAESGRDLTGLGSNGVAGLVMVTFGVGLLLGGKRRQAAMLVIATTLALVVNAALKLAVQRIRPDLVPGAPRVFTTSFPSSHAMVSTALFFAAATVVASLTPAPALRVFAFAMAALGSFLVGVSRIYLGVHWPTDVIGGWLGGLFCAWASVILISRVPGAAGRRVDGI